jgi:two-component system response regulator NreC
LFPLSDYSRPLKLAILPNALYIDKEMKYHNRGNSIAVTSTPRTSCSRIAPEASIEKGQKKPAFGGRLVAGNAETKTVPLKVRRSDWRFSQAKMRVLLCDDHTMFREGIKALLHSDPTIEVVGEAGDGKEAVDKALDLRPDVVLMDISMPSMVGYEALRRITREDRKIKVLVLTMHEEEDFIGFCLNAGASGYIFKDALASQLIEAIHVLHEGGKYLSPKAAKKIVVHYNEGYSPSETRYDTLGNREREILKLLADGLTVKEIASLLKLSVKTVDVHKYNLMHKLDIHNKTELIKYALQKKLISFSDFVHV